METGELCNDRHHRISKSIFQTMDVNLFKVEERPPFLFSLLNALQIVLCQVVSLVWLPLLLTPSLCLLPADSTRVNLVATAIFVSGVVSSLQSTLGLRLSSIAAPSVLYTSRFISLLQSPEWQCPSVGDLFAMGPDLRALEWQTRLRELQGVLLLAGVSQTILGFSGIQAWLCRVFSPTVLAPSIILAGLSVVHTPLNTHLDVDWTLFIIVISLIIVFCFCLREICLPLPTFSMQSGLTAKSFPVFRMFPVLWTCFAVYLIYKAGAMFSTEAQFPNTEAMAYQEAVDNSKWFFFSLPFDWGLPTLSKNSVVHMLPAIVLQTVLSMITFYGNAETCGMASPTKGAIRRGLGIEGLGLMFGAFWAQGVSTNTTNIGLMNLTGIVSRSSTQLAALLMVFLSHFTSLTAWLVDIPKEFLTALYLSLHVGVICVGFGLLKFVDLSSRRNSFIMGFSVFVGLYAAQLVSHQESIFLLPVGVGTLTAFLLELFLPGKASTNESAWRYREEDMKTYRLPTWEELLCSALERTAFFNFN